MKELKKRSEKALEVLEFKKNYYREVKELKEKWERDRLHSLSKLSKEEREEIENHVSGVNEEFLKFISSKEYLKDVPCPFEILADRYDSEAELGCIM